MSSLQRTETTNINENLHLEIQVSRILQPIVRPPLNNILEPNHQARASLPFHKRGSAALPCHCYKEKSDALSCAAVPYQTVIKSSNEAHFSDAPLTVTVTVYPTDQHTDIIDVDAKDKDKPYLVTEYVQDIFKYLRYLEGVYGVQQTFLFGHQITGHMRNILVDWLIDVCINFDFLPETLHLTIGLLDRYLPLNKDVHRNILQLVGITALLIAAKYEEVCVPPVSDFVFICDNAFTEKEIVKTELDILDRLKFSLGKPLSLHFLRRYGKIAMYAQDHHNLAKYFLEIFLFDYNICSIDPSLQAATACCFSICILDDISDPRIAWNKTLEYYSTYKYSDLAPVIIKLAKALSNMEKSKFQAIKKKYAEQKFGNISNHPKLQTSKIMKHLCNSKSNIS